MVIDWWLLVIVVMGLIVSGKIVIVIVLVWQLGGEIVSVDLVLVYCYLDIGLVKFDMMECVQVLYYLLDLCDFWQIYLVVEFVVDVGWVVVDIVVCGRMLIFVGGIGLYFWVLLQGLLLMLEVELVMCEVFSVEVVECGWVVLYVELVKVDLVVVVCIYVIDL